MTAATAGTEDVRRLNEQFEGAHPADAIRWAVENVTPGRLIVASSFGPTGMVNLHSLAEIAPELAARLVLKPGRETAGERVDVEARLLARALADVWRFLALAGDGDLSVTTLRAEPGTLMLRTRARTTRLPPDAAARLFTPLWARHTLGLADELSLSTARGILRRHQGDLRARQEPGGHLRVDAILPARAAGPAANGS